MPRFLVLAAVTLGTAFAASTPALAIQSVQKFKGSASPSRAGTSARPQAVSLTTRAYFDAISPDLDRAVQFATANARLYISRNGTTNNRHFPSCSTSRILQDESRCPAGSQVGTGTGRGIGIGLDEAITVKLFNRAEGRGVILLIVGDSPLIIREVVVGRLETLRYSSRYRYRLSFTVPQNLQSPAPGIIAALKDFRTTIPVQYLKRHGSYARWRSGIRKGQRIPYIATTGCSGGRWYAKYIAEYTTVFDGAIESSQAVTSSQRCLKARKG